MGMNPMMMMGMMNPMMGMMNPMMGMMNPMMGMMGMMRPPGMMSGGMPDGCGGMPGGMPGGMTGGMSGGCCTGTEATAAITDGQSSPGPMRDQSATERFNPY